MIHTYFIWQQIISMSGVYQFRTFKPLPENHQFQQSESFTDIYLHREDCSTVGIKFRDPKQKDYGWKLSCFECKIAQTQKHEGILMEKWKKHILQMDEAIKLKVRPSKKKSQQQQSQNDPDQERVIRKTFKLQRAVSKALLKSNLADNKAIRHWCSQIQEGQSQLELFVVQKNKIKAGGRELGTLKIERLGRDPKNYYFQTDCVENKNYNGLLNKFKEDSMGNVSYPRLLSSLMARNESEKKEE